MNFKEKREWNAESSVVWKEIVARWGADDYADETKRAEHQATLKAEYDNNQYQRDRAAAYPSLKEQADMAYWDRQNGTTTLDDAISAVKAQYPKP